MKTINFNGQPTATITEMQFELELSYIGMNFKGGWKQWSNRDIEMLEEKLNILATPVLPYEGFIKLHDLNYVWED